LSHLPHKSRYFFSRLLPELSLIDIRAGTR